MCEAKDKKSSANNHVSVTQKVVELGGGVGWEAEKRDWWKGHTYTPKSEMKDSKMLTVIIYRLQPFKCY